MLRGQIPFEMRKNDKNCIFPKTWFSNVKFIVESEFEEIMLIALMVFELLTYL